MLKKFTLPNMLEKVPILTKLSLEARASWQVLEAVRLQQGILLRTND